MHMIDIIVMGSSIYWIYSISRSDMSIELIELFDEGLVSSELMVMLLDSDSTGSSWDDICLTWSTDYN